MKLSPSMAISPVLVPGLLHDGQRQCLGVRFLPADDLFANMARMVTDSAPPRPSTGVLESLGPVAVIAISDNLFVSVKHALIRPVLIQSFVSALVEQAQFARAASWCAELKPVIIDPAFDLTTWTSAGNELSAVAASIWSEIKAGSRPDPLDGLTTPSIYGSKLRMAGTLHAIAVAKLAPGTPILDVMSGTGIITRTLARRHPVTSNDANPYAALLTRAQSVAFGKAGDEVATALLDALREPWFAHADQLRVRYANAIEIEESFLHEELREGSLELYQGFVREPLLSVKAEDSRDEVGDLITSRYANAYFGVAQSIEIDAIRLAIEISMGGDERRRDLCLAALVLATCRCNSGPHFAQPRKINSHTALRHVIERRARSIGWEFEVALRRLASRKPLPHQGGPVTCSDWRAALEKFDAATSRSSARAVYLDPPYSKLQYSRYYHVLNVLLANDYPQISGTGRYPPRSYRFSSRFEYQPATAKQEFQEVVDRCRSSGMHLIVSYGTRGFIPVEKLVEILASRYQNVNVFSEELRHHSQGTSLSAASGGHVTEYVFVSSP